MFKILHKEELSEYVTLFDIAAEDIAKKAKPGNFVLLKIHEEGERIPLTIADFDREKGSLTIVFQKVGKTTHHLGTLDEGDFLLDVIGPLGLPSHIENFGKVVCIGGGVGIAPVYPITRALKDAGNNIFSIIGARTKDLIFWEDKMRNVSDELTVTTDDGSYGRKALVTVPLEELLKNGGIDLVVAIGPAIMMKFVCKTTEKYNTKTVVSLNSVMIDGTGMCGGCRVDVGGETKFCCVDGPEFDGHKVNFDILMERQKMYLDEEKAAMERYREKTGG
ncbi:MAG TPA: sulfide/dihydroorotate dehydrogenase-like FAD/NAD-binding protein [Nitrospirae bacterium]|nr:sulfide/dihydroorotate dehydrogenase-like FAD/NAD-binding protein [Nitrospirota bacterium]HDZ03356.1 sulfide/dihydroorotate dehydrogenase-like FAD/NAD-binding protein [Nitrospirota bacterium]